MLATWATPLDTLAHRATLTGKESGELRRVALWASRHCIHYTKWLRCYSVLRAIYLCAPNIFFQIRKLNVALFRKGIYYFKKIIDYLLSISSNLKMITVYQLCRERSRYVIAARSLTFMNHFVIGRSVTVVHEQWVSETLFRSLTHRGLSRYSQCLRGRHPSPIFARSAPPPDPSSSPYNLNP